MSGASSDNNVLSYLDRAARRVPDRAALIFDGSDGRGDRLTFGRLRDRVDRVARGLAASGLSPGERAIVMIPMSADLYAAMLGVLQLGAVAVFVDPWVGARQIAAFSAFAEPTAYVGVGRSHLLRLLDRRLRSIALSITSGRRLGPLPASRTLAEIEGLGRPHSRGLSEAAPVEPDDPALITFTSGSSGLPKGTNRTHRFLAAQHQALAAEFPYSDHDIDMPMFPVFALNNLALGIPSVVPAMDFRRVDQVDGAAIVGQMRAHAVSTATASPPFFDRVVEHLKTSGDPPLRLRRILTGGAPVRSEQLERWQEALPETAIEVVYGSTEAEPVAHIGAADKLAAEAEASGAAGYCVGRPSSFVRTRLAPIRRAALDAEVEDLPAGEIGELLVTGGHVCKDYYRNSEAVLENKWIDPSGETWHRMGDTGYFDDRERFWLVGRVHSTILRAGRPVHAQLVEQAAGAGVGDPGPRAAIGLPDPKLGERVVLALERSLTETERATLADRLEAAGQPVDEIVCLGAALPLDPRHRSKIDYPELRAKLLGTPRDRRGAVRSDGHRR